MVIPNLPDPPSTDARPRIEFEDRQAGRSADVPPSVHATVLGEEVHLLDYVKVLYKRRWTAITIFTIVFVSVAVYTFTAERIYESKVQILIEKENSNVIDFKEAFEQNQIADDYYQTQYKLLQSRLLAKRTMDSLNLWANATFTAASKSESGTGVSGALRSAKNWIITTANEKPVAPSETTDQSPEIDRFLGNLAVSPVRNSRLVDVRFRSTDPKLAATVANALARAYIEQNLEFKFLASKEASDWLGQQLAEQRKHVEGSEIALQRYREQTDSVSLEDRENIVVQKLADLNAAVTKAKTERIQKEAAYNQFRSLQNDRSSMDAIPAILSNAFIQQQKLEIADLQRQQAQRSETLGPNHPEMLRLSRALQQVEAKLQAEIGKVALSLRNDFQSAQAQEQSLAAALEQQKNEALALSKKGINYGALSRDAATNRQIYESLLQRTKETGISGELKTSNIRVVDAAEIPRHPVTPNTRNNMLAALFGGLTFAVGVALFFEYLDNRIKTPDQLKTDLGLPFLGMVPALFDSDNTTPLISKDVPANFSESFRSIRTNVLFSSAQSGGRSLVVTSTGPNEGKTLVAANLAIALAQSGQRVLLIDADMRKPRVHEVFRAKLEPGLSNVLVGSAKAATSVVQAGLVPGLWVLPAGLHPPNPAELLGSRRFADFLSSLSEHFDWVVVDTPPVMAVTDSSIVAHLTNGVLFVVGAEMTSRHAARRAVEQLENARAKFVGGVLNRVDLKHNAYYYSQYYRKEYAEYYSRVS